MAVSSILFEELLATGSVAGNQVAVVDGEARLTYLDLVQAADEFCQDLEAAGVRLGDRVAVILGNQREFLIAAFGIWKRGAVLLPLNPQLREAEIGACLLDSSTRTLVTAFQSERLLRSLRGNDVGIDHAWLWSPDLCGWKYEGVADAGGAAPVAGPVETCPASAGARLPAVSQYSTGSTGRPKRVTRTHGQLLGEVRSVASVIGMRPAERVLGAAPYFHSYGLVVSGLLTLLSGGTLYVVDTFFPGRVARLIERESMSGLPLVPPMFQLLVDCKQTCNFSSLRFCLSAGAPLPAATAARFAGRFGKTIRHLYGSTETGVISISDDRPAGDDAASVGPPIPGVSVEVVDETQRPLAPGEDGLIRIRSGFAATRYDGNDSGADSYFIEQAFVPGDNGRLDVNGGLHLSGRRRSFVNTNGYKVDPAEVERVLLELPGVTEAIVVGVTDGSADEQVKAILIAPSGTSQQAVREHCLERLAPFKCPRIIEFRSELPRNPLGKVLRKYLLDPTPPTPPTTSS